MNKIVKLFTLIFLLSPFLISCNPKQRADIEKMHKEQEEKRIGDSIEATKRYQYIMSETFTGGRSQIIDLVKGPATFIINHEGNGLFVARLMKGDGTLLEELANVTGNYKGNKTIEVPATTAYILDVKTQGKWAITRK